MKKTLLILLLLIYAAITFAQSDVMVVAHRSDWRNYADNSVEGIEGCIKMGVDVVEIDVSKTKDGHLVLMHDGSVNRTTNGQGEVRDLLLEEIKNLRLKNGLGRACDEFKVPTLEEAMVAAKGKIMVNIDKGDEYFDDVYKILQKTGTINQVIIKSGKSHKELYDRYGENFEKMIFMPVVNINKDTKKENLDEVLDKQYPYYEIIFDKEDCKDQLLYVKEKLKGTTSRIWINSLWDSLCAGYSDDKALTDPDGTWGYLIEELGASMLQTDRPAYMIEYLKSKSLRK